MSWGREGERKEREGGGREERGEGGERGGRREGREGGDRGGREEVGREREGKVIKGESEQQLVFTLTSCRWHNQQQPRGDRTWSAALLHSHPLHKGVVTMVQYARSTPCYQVCQY